MRELTNKQKVEAAETYLKWCPITLEDYQDLFNRMWYLFCEDTILSNSSKAESKL